MAIRREDVQVCMLKILKVSIRVVWNCMKTHPYVSCTLIFLGLLYTCNPSFFWLVIYLSTFICIVVSTAKIYYRFGNANDPRRDEKNISDAKPVRTSRLVKNDVHARSVRRRRSRETSRDDYSQTSEEEKSTVFSSTFNHGMVDKSAIIEQQPKEIREVEVDSLVCHAECSSSNRLRDSTPEFRIKSHEGSQRLDRERGEIETESSEGTEGEDDERDKEEDNKAVQWNEDDQKNLMDVGISEIERNRRLESLIARRRARKLLSLQVRKTLMNMDNSAPFGHITPLMVPRHNPSILNPPSGRFSPMPGSAPSVLIPMHNPFDIPYDPQEEKPILTGGSFDQEFLPLHQKDIFSRYESSSLEPSFPGESKQDREDASQLYDCAFKERDSEQHENFGLESQLDQKDTEKIIEVETSQPPKSNSNMVRDRSYTQEHIQSPEQGVELVDGCLEEENCEVKTTSMPSDDLSGKSSTPSSSEEEEQFPRVDKDAILKSLSSPVSRNISTRRDSRSDMERDLSGCGPSMLYDNKMEGHSFADKAFSHTPTYSISSDLQVEVSEISSPPLTVDGSMSSHDENRISEGSMEGEITSSIEDMLAASPHQCGGGDEKESILRDIHEVSKLGTIEVSNTKSCEEPVALAGEMIEEAPNPLTQLTSNAEFPDASQDHPSGFNFSSKENYRKPNTCDSESGVSEKPEQQSCFSENTEKEKRTCNPDDSSLLAENFSVGEKDSEADGWIQEGGRAHAEWSLTSSPTYIGYTEDQPGMMEEHDEIFAYYEAVGENNNPITSEDSGGESIDMPQYENLDMAMAVEEHDTQESNQGNEGGQHTADIGFPRVNERYNRRQVSRLLPQLLIQQVPIASITSSSPRSVLQPKFSIDHSSSSHYIDEMHEEFGTPMAEISNLLNEAGGESLPFSTTITTTLAVEDTTSRMSHGRGAVLQESSSLSTTSALKANNGSGNECTVHKYERGQSDLTNFSTSSTEQANYSGFGSQCRDRENERENYEPGNFHESSSERSSSCPESTSSKLKPMDEPSSRMFKEKNEGPEELHDNEAPIPLADKIAQAEELSMPQISPQEPAKFLGPLSEVTYNPKKNEMLVQEMEEKSKDFLRNLMQAFKD